MATPDSLNKELKKVVQTTGFIAGGGLDTLQGRISSQLRTTNDIASIVHQLNVVYYNIVKTLTDGSDTGRENVLETGIAGTNIICYQDATEGSCYWADLLEKPATIKEVFDCVLGRLSSLENQILEGIDVSEYDDSSLVARLDCIELNLLQIMKDTLGSGSYGCDGSSDFIYSLASIINALGANFDGFTPIHVAHSGESTPGPYTLSVYSSNIIWDVAVSQTNVENLASDLTCIRDAIGMTASDDCNNEYSTETPSAATAGNNVVADGDSLREAIKALDGAVGSSNYWTTIDFDQTGTGTFAGSSSISADNSSDTIEFVAGDGIRINALDDPERVRWSVENYSLQDAYAYSPHGRINLDNTYPINQQGLSLMDNVTPCTGQLLQVADSSGSHYMRLGKHENYTDSVLYENYRMDLKASPIYFEPQQYTPATTGPALGAPFNSTTRGAIWVSSGTSAFQDKFGNDLVANHIYYREPNQGLIHDLTCCQHLADGYTIADPATVNDPFEDVIWTESPGSDTRLSRAHPSGTNAFLAYQEHPNNGGQVHYSIEVVDPTGNDTAGADGANYVAINHHESAVLFSKLSSATNIPETHANQGALFIPNDGTVYNQTPVTAGRLYYRAPSNGNIYDLTSTAAGSAQNLFDGIQVDVSGGILNDSFPIKVAAVGELHFHTDVPLNGETVTITDTNGLTRTYTGSSVGTDAANGLFSVNNASDAIDGLDLCINHPNGHNGSITTSQPVNDRLVLTQIAGVKGNTVIAHTFSQPGITVTNFAGGSSTSSATSVNDKFVFVAGGGITLDASDDRLELFADLSSVSVHSLSDVNASNPSNSQVLVYDAGNSEYVNKDYTVTQTAGGSGVSLVGADTLGGGKTIKGVHAASSKLSVIANGNNADIDIDIGTLNVADLSDVTAPSPNNEDVLMWTGAAWVASAPNDYRRGGINTGTGEDLIKQVTNDNIEIKSLKTNSSQLTISSTSNEVYIDYTPSGTGESLANTLAIGNTTGGQNIVVSGGDEIQGAADLVLKASDHNVDLMASGTGNVRVRSGSAQDLVFLQVGESPDAGLGFIPPGLFGPDGFFMLGPKDTTIPTPADSSYIPTQVNIRSASLDSTSAGVGKYSGNVQVTTGDTSFSGAGTVPGSSGSLSLNTGTVTGNANSGTITARTGNSSGADSGPVAIYTGTGNVNSGGMLFQTGDAITGTSGGIVLETGPGATGRGKVRLNAAGVDVKVSSAPTTSGADWVTLFAADNSDTANYTHGGLYYLDPTSGSTETRRIDLPSVDTEHVNLPEAPNDTVYYYGWASRDCRLTKAEAFSVVVATQGNYTLTMEKKVGQSWVNMLSTTNFNMKSLTALTPGDLSLTATAADLRFAANDVWRIGIASDSAQLDAEGVYVRMAFEAV